MLIAGIIFFVGGFILLILSSYQFGVDEVFTDPKTRWAGIFVLLLFSGIMLAGLYNFVEYAEKVGFKQGQIEAELGNQHFELQTLPDSTRVWVDTRN